MFRMLGFVFAMSVASLLSAQTVYQPLEYEYNSGGTLYFYSGDNPAVHAAAAEPMALGAAWGRRNGFAFAAASASVSREVETERIRIFSDAWRYGLQDASIVGMTVADVRNQAYASVPRYFQKAQLLRDATTVDGIKVVPARLGGITIRKSSGAVISTPPRPVMILPKSAVTPSRTPVLRASVD